MPKTHRAIAPVLQSGLELILSLAGFSILAVVWSRADSTEPPSAQLWAALVCGSALWLGLRWGTSNLPTGTFLQPVVVGIGQVLIAESILSYTESSTLPLEPLAGGCLLSTVLVVIARKVFRPQRQLGVTMLLGYGTLGPSVIETLGPSLAGIVAKQAPDLPRGIPYLGGVDALEEQVRLKQPSRLMTDLSDWEEYTSLRFLLDCKLRGIAMESAAATEERARECIPVEGMQPSELLWSKSIRANRRIMAVQAVYSNLVGLSLLVAVSPMLIVGGIAARIAAGPGSLFEKTECAGFQGIPFFRRQFRTMNAEGKMTSVGLFLSKLRLTRLPQVINLVRGEMALVGPQPVRMAFAEYLDDLSPVFTGRLLVKPGIFGWAQAHGGGGGTVEDPGLLASYVQEETHRIAYDFYYLRFGSPLVDFTILGRTLLGLGRSQKN